MGFGLAPFVFALLLNAGASVGLAVENRFLVGGGVDIPFRIAIPSQGDVAVSLPILFGPMAEFHLTPPLAVTLDLKVGPHINTGGTVFGIRLLAGAAYRF